MITGKRELILVLRLKAIDMLPCRILPF